MSLLEISMCLSGRGWVGIFFQNFETHNSSDFANDRCEGSIALLLHFIEESNFLAKLARTSSHFFPSAFFSHTLFLYRNSSFFFTILCNRAAESGYIDFFVI